jgi:CheY-like chemotaxis protein
MTPFFKTILLVDDDHATNHYHEIILEDWEISENICAVSSGQEALDFLLKNPQDKPTLIMLDVNMPIMNGFEFLEQYEQLPEEQKASFVIFMLTSSLHAKDVERASQFQSVNGYCEKPMTKEMMDTIVEKIKNSMLAYA